jgi:hypothetical protein
MVAGHRSVRECITEYISNTSSLFSQLSKALLIFLEKQGHLPPVPNILKPTIQTTSFRVSHFKHLQTITLQTNTQLKTSSFKTTTLQTTRGRKATGANSRRQGEDQP